jgi:Flp pilus assembly pilin Flp
MEQGAVRLIRDYLADETGGGAIEYALVATLTSLAIIGSAGTIGLALVGKMDAVREALAAAIR